MLSLLLGFSSLQHCSPRLWVSLRQVVDVAFAPEAPRVDFQVKFGKASHSCPACSAAIGAHERLVIFSTKPPVRGTRPAGGVETRATGRSCLA